MTAAAREDLPAAVEVVGPRALNGTVRMPGDKSISHRVLLMAGVAQGTSTLTGLASGDDVDRTRRAFEHLGVAVENGRATESVVVHGGGWDGLRVPREPIDCGNSGSTMRMLCGVLAGRPFRSVLTGDDSLRRRPMARIVDPLWSMGAQVEGAGREHYAPLTIKGGRLRGMVHHLSIASAQVKSALLLAGLQASGSTTVIEPSASRDHTERLLAAIGAPAEVGTIAGAVRVEAATLPSFDLHVPGDPSSAAFFIVGALVTPGSDVTVDDLCLNPTRVAFLDVLARMGGSVEVTETGTRGGEPVGSVRARHSPLGPFLVEGAEVPLLIDEVPALAVAAACAEGTSEVRDALELRAKESDRIQAVHVQLARAGIEVVTYADGFTVSGGTPQPAVFDSHGDHRIAMACAILGNATAGASRVEGWPAVASSFPTFAEVLDDLTGER